jgi:hypothetical protein
MRPASCLKRSTSSQQVVLRKWGRPNKHQHLCCYHQQFGQTEFLSANEQIINFFIYIRLRVRAEGTLNFPPAQSPGRYVLPFETNYDYAQNFSNRTFIDFEFMRTKYS